MKCLFTAYSPIDLIRSRLAETPPDKPLLGCHVVLTGRGKGLARRVIVRWLIRRCGARVTRSVASIRPETLVLVGPEASERWKNGARGGLKLERALNVRALITTWAVARNLILEKRQGATARVSETGA